MARRRKKGSRKTKSIAVLPVLPVAYAVWDSYKVHGLTGNMLGGVMMRVTGYNPILKEFKVDNAKAFWIGEGVAIIVHKVANKTGVNKYIRKLTGGWISA